MGPDEREKRFRSLSPLRRDSAYTQLPTTPRFADTGAHESPERGTRLRHFSPATREVPFAPREAAFSRENVDSHRDNVFTPRASALAEFNDTGSTAFTPREPAISARDAVFTPRENSGNPEDTVFTPRARSLAEFHATFPVR